MTATVTHLGAYRDVHRDRDASGMELLAAYGQAMDRRWRPNTARLRKGYIERAAREVDLLTATTDDLIDYLDSHPDWKPRTRSTVLETLRSFYRWAIEFGHTTDNPAARIRRPEIPKKRSRKADDLVIRRALEHASSVDRAILLLGAECGLRCAEIASLHVDDRDGDWLYVTGKGGNQRQLYMSPELQAALDVLAAERMRADGYYFPGQSRGRHASTSTIWGHVREAIEYNTHALRHRAGTAVYRNSGNDLRLAQEFLGHASPATTAIYLHVEQRDLIRASAASRLAA